MSHALYPAGSFGNIEWCATHRRLTRTLFGAIERAAVVFPNAPVRVVRRRGDDTDLVLTRCKPGGHLSGVFTDSCEFRRVVQTVNQNSQELVPVGLDGAIAL